MSPYDLLLAPFVEFDFMRRALVGCAALALGSAPVGVFLMLRRMSLTGDAMAHAILPGAAVGFLVAGLSLPAMTLGGLVAGLLVALLAGMVSRTTVLREDATLASFYLISLASGVLLVSLRGSNVDLMHVLFGTVLALNDPALYLLAAIATASMLTLALLWRPIVLECVDAQFLRSVSRMSGLAHAVLSVLVVVNLVGGFQALGTLLAVGLMILPAASARLWTRELGPLIGLSVAFGLASALAGLVLSFHAELPSGPAIILAAGVGWLLSLLFGSTGGVLRRLWPTRHLEA
jgi:zinc/manganese transport system permease protein